MFSEKKEIGALGFNPNSEVFTFRKVNYAYTEIESVYTAKERKSTFTLGVNSNSSSKLVLRLWFEK